MTAIATGPVAVGPITEDHFERWHQLRQQAFGGQGSLEEMCRFLAIIPEDRRLGAFVHGTLVASAVDLAFAQTWSGTPIGCAGVAGVIVAHEARGNGLARRVMAGLFEVMATEDEPISALFPTTAPLYRSLGYEVVGDLVVRDVPLASMPEEADGRGAPATETGSEHDPVVWTPISLADPRLAVVDRAAAAAHTGWLRRSDARYDALVVGAGIGGTPVFAYLATRADQPVAVVAYENGERAADGLQVLDVHLAAAIDAEAWRACLGFLARHQTMGSSVRLEVPTAVLRQHLPNLPRARVHTLRPWMLRINDPGAAISARPAPAALRGRIDFDLEPDPVTGTGGGPHRLEVADGRATLTGGGSGSVSCPRTTLAQAYAGVDVAVLVAAGRLAGASDDDAALIGALWASTGEVQFYF